MYVVFKWDYTTKSTSDFQTHPICVADATLEESSSLLYLAGLREKKNILSPNISGRLCKDGQ